MTYFIFILVSLLFSFLFSLSSSIMLFRKCHSQYFVLMTTVQVHVILTVWDIQWCCVCVFFVMICLPLHNHIHVHVKNNLKFSFIVLIEKRRNRFYRETLPLGDSTTRLLWEQKGVVNGLGIWYLDNIQTNDR